MYIEMSSYPIDLDINTILNSDHELCLSLLLSKQPPQRKLADSHFLS